MAETAPSQSRPIVHGRCHAGDGESRNEAHRDQAIVNQYLAEQLFGHQYPVKMVKRLPRVVTTLNRRVKQLTGQRPVAVIKKQTVYAQASTASLRRSVGELKNPPRRGGLLFACSQRIGRQNATCDRFELVS